jgi:hypothetical protein
MVWHGLAWFFGHATAPRATPAMKPFHLPSLILGFSGPREGRERGNA